MPATADLNRTKMSATQSVMRNTSLTESAKRSHIQSIQRLARDAGLDDAEKVARMEEVAAAAAAGGVGVAAKGGEADEEDTGSSTDERSSSSASTDDNDNDNSDDSSVSTADVGKAKMKATQDIMRNTSLNQAEKPGLIRKVQAVAADDKLSPEAKVRRMRNLADGRDEDEGAQVGGNDDAADSDSADADVSDADVAKAKMRATQDIMRNTTLDQAEKPALIRKVQAVSADANLANLAKVAQMQRLAEGKDGGDAPGSSSSSSSSSSPSSSPAPTRDVSDADVNKAKMEATQKIMRDTSLNQAEKPKMIREVQAACADGSLDNGAKVDKIQGIVSKAGTPSPSTAAAAAASSTEDTDAKKSPADLGEEKEAEAGDDDDDDEPVDGVDLTAFKSEVIQGLIKNKGIAGEEKQAKIRAAHAVVLNRTYDDGEKIRRLRKIQRGKDVVEPIGESVFAPLPVPGAPVLAAPEEVAAPTAGNGTADERLRAKMSGGAAGGGGGGQAGVTTNSTANDRLRAKMQGGSAAAGGGAAGGAAPGVSVGSTANDRLRGKLFLLFFSFYIGPPYP